MKANPRTTTYPFNDSYIPTLDDLAEFEDAYRDIPLIGMRERYSHEEE